MLAHALSYHNWKTHMPYNSILCKDLWIYTSTSPLYEIGTIKTCFHEAQSGLLLFFTIEPLTSHGSQRLMTKTTHTECHHFAEDLKQVFDMAHRISRAHRDSQRGKWQSKPAWVWAWSFAYTLWLLVWCFCGTPSVGMGVSLTFYLPRGPFLSHLVASPSLDMSDCSQSCCRLL